MESHQAHEEGDVELELAALQRKYRIMEGNRKSYSEDSQKTIANQRLTIEKLKKDNNSLKTEINLHKKRELAPMTPNMQQRINKAQENADFYSQKIEEESLKAERLKAEIEMYSKTSMETRKNMGGVNAARENTQYVSKQIKILENRLDKALVKFNEALAKNKELRKEIDNLRRERVVFDQIYKKLEKELEDKKKEMANVIEISNVAYEARDQAQNEITALRAQADREQTSFEIEIQELTKVIDTDKKAHEMHRKQSLLKASAHLEEINALKRKQTITQVKNIGNQKSNKVQSYEEAFQKIREATGISDIDEFVTNFLVNEDQNFSLYNYLNDLNRESEKIEEQIMEIGIEIERHKGQDEMSESHHKQVVKDLEQKIADSKAKSEKYDLNYQMVQRGLTTIKAAIVNICNKTGCTAMASKDLLLEGVTESNMAQYLALIEQRATEINMMFLNSAAYQSISEASEFKATGPQLVRSQTVPGIQIDPPSTNFEQTEDSSDSEDEMDDRPLTRTELQAKTARNIIKRNERAKNRKKK